MATFPRLAVSSILFCGLAAGPCLARTCSPPRLIARIDLALLGAPNAGSDGGGGVMIPPGGTGAGLVDAVGGGVGGEIRLFRWIALDAGVDWYRPSLEVDRDRGPDVRVDSRTAAAGLRTVTLGLVVTPPRWRFPGGRVAVAALVSRSDVSGVAPRLGIAVEQHSTGLGVDLRGELFPSRTRRWGVGGALSFVSPDPRFVDLETDRRGSLQIGELRLRLGVRGAW